ncbi:hypothetical protein SAMN05216227_101145 [Pseudorhodobacter antarcticus]|jgi:hypothetical protein|uniref:Major facilitator superfamily (MFS) profile domain-containing protein n=1 Tax=Pseudorhodobacter antarcticus TaxID=1077947 RepID=A0A1H8FLC3_9RHOB|nr:hypothetical protein [Pseudorhodobacter antarcticus]SEN32415.1 hypothetical protein SAMN05216227_101145 [Pseudorhodobacter antarcticus]
MVIGILVSGIIAGLFATIGSLTFGLPIWAAVLLYPVAGSLGAVGFIVFAMARMSQKEPQPAVVFATQSR